MGGSVIVSEGTVPHPSVNPIGLSSKHNGEHPSFPSQLPSSHCSVACFTPSPQNSYLHSALQPSSGNVFPSSHCSVAAIIESPQITGGGGSVSAPAAATVVPEIVTGDGMSCAAALSLDSSIGSNRAIPETICRNLRSCNSIHTLT